MKKKILDAIKIIICVILLVKLIYLHFDGHDKAVTKMDLIKVMHNE